jgi:hypothetical protein
MSGDRKREWIAVVAGALLLSGCAIGGSVTQTATKLAGSKSCRGSLPVQVVHRLRRDWARPTRHLLSAFASHEPVSSEVVAEVQSRSSNIVALVKPGTWQTVAAIERLPSDMGAGGAFDQNYAVYMVYRDLGGGVVKVWRRATGTVTTVSVTHRDRQGRPVEGGWEDPVLEDGYAAWTEGLTADGLSQLVLLDLASGKRFVVRRGHVGWFAIVGHQLVWAESLHPGQMTTMLAVDLRTRAPAPLPRALRSVRGGWGFVSDGTAIGWVGGSKSDQVYLARSPSEPAVAVATDLGRGGFSPPLALGGGVLGVTISAQGLILVDAKTLRYTVLDEAYGATTVGSTLFVSQFNSARKTMDLPDPAPITSTDLAGMRCSNQ